MSDSFDVSSWYDYIETLLAAEEFDAAKNEYLKRAKAGCHSSCLFLATAFNPNGTVFPVSFDLCFKKSIRRSNRYSNRFLKCARKSARCGEYTAMYNLYNAHYYGHPHLAFKNRFVLAYYWLRQSSKSGSEIPRKEMQHIGLSQSG